MMPSFDIHTIAGRELLKKINIDKDDEIKFLIGNLMPDSRAINIDPNWNYFEKRKNIQEEKIKTHFRTSVGELIEYPNLDLFLSKYEDLVKRDVAALGYFYHLYTDYFYFTKSIPRSLEFYDEDFKITNVKRNHKYVKMLKSNKVVPAKIFWTKGEEDSIYSEYSKVSKYLAKKYNYNIDCNIFRDYINNNKLEFGIEEVKSENATQVIDRLEKVNKRVNNSNEEFNMFTEEGVDRLIDLIVLSFISRYDYLLSNYK